MSNNYYCDCHSEICDSFIVGNSVDIDLCKGDSEVRVDVSVDKNKKRCIRLWGQVKDCDNDPVADAQVKLLKSYYYHGKIEFKGEAHTNTDCMGFYQFDVYMEDEHSKYRILVGKASTGKERIIHGECVCDPCKCDPCKCDPCKYDFCNCNPCKYDPCKCLD